VGVPNLTCLGSLLLPPASHLPHTHLPVCLLPAATPLLTTTSTSPPHLTSPLCHSRLSFFFLREGGLTVTGGVMVHVVLNIAGDVACLLLAAHLNRYLGLAQARPTLQTRSLLSHLIWTQAGRHRMVNVFAHFFLCVTRVYASSLHIWREGSKT